MQTKPYDGPLGWMRDSPLEGLRVMVVGAASGIGAAAARIYAANGATVMLVDLDGDAARGLAEDLTAEGGRAQALRLDLGDPDEIAPSVAATVAGLGGLDILVNTSAFVRAAPLDDGPGCDWRRSFAVNVEGALLLAQAALPHLKASRHATIVLTASLAGLHSFPRGAAYGPSKAALIALARQMALEWAEFGIRVNVVLPGTIDTPMARASQSAEVRALREATIPLKRLGEPAEVANLIAFLSAPVASYVTAETFAADGGLSHSLFLKTFDAAPMRVRRADPRQAGPDWMRRSSLEGLSALVVGGGGGGIGASTARVLAANGARVCVVDLDAGSAEAVAQQIRAEGGEAMALGGDVASAEDRCAAVDAAAKAFGGLDILINAAALVRPKPLAQASLGEWQACFDVNVDSALALAQLCLPHLRQSPAASIVNVASLGGVFGRPYGAAYGPSKAALITLTRQMALEWAEQGIRANAATPGTVMTPLARQSVPPEVLAERATRIPLKRLGTPLEMANVIAFLASPASSYVTGQLFSCDGGHANALFFDPMGQSGAQHDQ